MLRPRHCFWRTERARNLLLQEEFKTLQPYILAGWLRLVVTPPHVSPKNVNFRFPTMLWPTVHPFSSYRHFAETRLHQNMDNCAADFQLQLRITAPMPQRANPYVHLEMTTSWLLQILLASPARNLIPSILSLKVC